MTDHVGGTRRLFGMPAGVIPTVIVLVGVAPLGVYGLVSLVESFIGG